MDTLTSMRDRLIDLWYDQRPAIIAIGLLLAVTVGRAMWLPEPTQTASAPVQPLILIATAQPTPQIKASQSGLQSAVVAFDAPGGNVIGAIEPGRSYRVVARSGANWLHVEIDGSGLVWLKTNDLNPNQANIPDIATQIPQPQPAQIIVVNAPMAAPTFAPLPTIAPDQETQAVDNTFAASFTDPNPNAKCQFVGCLAGGDK